MTLQKSSTTQEVDIEKVKSFQERVIKDVAGMVSVAAGSIGDKLGLYRVLANSGPVTPAELAKLTGHHERYLLQWLINQAASEYVVYDPESGKFHLPAEHAVVLADEDSPMFTAGFLQAFAAFGFAVPRITECFEQG